MINVIYVPNRLSLTGREEQELDFNRDKSIKNYIEEAGLIGKYELSPHTIIVSGKVIQDINQHIDNQDEILVTPQIEGWLWPALVFIWNALQVGMVLYSVYSAISYRAPKTQSLGDGFGDDSPTYGWDGITTLMDVGIPIPVVYGTHRIGGNIINSYISNDGDKNYMNLLISLCEGEITSVSSIKINEQPIANFDGIAHTELMGTNSDAIIAGFEDSKTNYSVNVTLNTLNDTHTYTTISDAIEGFDVLMEFPSGLFSADDEGNINSWSVSYKVEYKKHSDGDYTTLGTYAVSGKTRTVLRRTASKSGLDADQYNIKVTRTTATGDFYHTGDLTWASINENIPDDIAYQNIAKSGIKALATEQLSGATPNFTFLVAGRKISCPDVRDGSSNYVPYDDYYWNTTYSEYRELVGDGSCTWNGTTYVTEYCANPVWCLYDLLTNQRFGLGKFIDTSYITKSDWATMSKYCDEKVSDGNGGYEKRFVLDIVLDSSCRALDCLMQICATFRGILFYSGGIVKLVIDKAGSPVQLFTMGNIIDGSFNQYWKSRKEFNNLIEIQYNDEEKDYAAELVSVIDSTSITAGDEVRKKSIRLFTARQSQALREAKYILNVGKYVQRSIVFKAGIDAVACQAGDIISLSHDVTQWGFSGRVQAGSIANRVMLDRAVTIEGGKTYSVMVRFADDSIEERTVSDGAGTYTQVNTTSTFSQTPAAYDVYAFGETGKVKKDFRILGMKRDNNLEVEITAIEYDADLYDTDTIILPDDNYSALSTTVANVSNLNLTEGVAVAPDGSVRNTLEIWWNKPDDSTVDFQYRYKSCKVYLTDNAGSSYEMIGVSEGTSFIYNGDLVKGTTYKVVLQSVAVCGIEGNFASSPYDTLAIAGRTSIPDNVAGFTYSWTDLLLLAWSPNDDLDLAGYEVRDEDANWGTVDAHMIYQGLAIRKTLQPTTRSVGTYYIKAFNTSGIYSTASVNITPTNAAPSAPTGLAADVFFNLARVYWTDVAGSDVKYYEVYKSETDAWAGEETLYAKVSGKSLNMESKTPRMGECDSSTTTTIVDADLIGLGDDFLNGDIIEITAGTGIGQTRTITDFIDASGTIQVATWTTQPDTTSRFMVYDKIYVKVRGVDVYGEGTFTSSLAVTFEALMEEALADQVISARKIYVACLSALSANMGCLTSGIIEGGTIQSAGGGARTIIDDYGIRSYDADCCLNVSICRGTICLVTAPTGARIAINPSGIYAYDGAGCNVFSIDSGCINATTIKLSDPACSCNYSYLYSGALKFHDILGDVPYVKRICHGTVCTGGTVNLLGWCDSPKVMISIYELMSYNSANSVSCQDWRVYSDTPVWYCTSATCYGYCFVAHAALTLSGGMGGECVKDINFDVCTCTGTGVCGTYLRMRFQLWCNNAAPSNYWWGTLCYALCYRCLGSGTWCACCYCFAQPHANVTELKTTQNDYHCIIFPCSAQWELMAHQVSLGWSDTGICATTTTYSKCYRNFSSLYTGYICASATGFGCECGCSRTCCIAMDGSNPSCACAAAVYWCWCSVGQHVCGYACVVSGGYACGMACARFDVGSGGDYCCACCCLASGGGYMQCQWTTTAKSSSASTGANYAYLRLCVYGCGTTNGTGSGFANTCLIGGCYMICYGTVSGSAACCAYENLYTIQDTLGTACVVDPTGCLNWLAISYS